MQIGEPFNETGILVRDGGGFVLRRDAGGRCQLELSRMPIDEIEKRVRVIGTIGADDHVLVEGVSLV